MSLLKPSTKALALSCKVSVRTDTRGFLSLQYLIRNDDGQICFVEYYCCPDVEVDNEWLYQFPLSTLISRNGQSIYRHLPRGGTCGALFEVFLWIPMFCFAICYLPFTDIYHHTNLQLPVYIYTLQVIYNTICYLVLHFCNKTIVRQFSEWLLMCARLKKRPLCTYQSRQ